MDINKIEKSIGLNNILKSSRNTWNISPVQKVKESKKQYNRKKNKEISSYES